MTESKNCVFCKIVANEIPSYRVWEDQNFVAFLNINPVVAGHLLIIPKGHIDSVFELPEELYHGLFDTGKLLAEPLKLATDCKRVGLSVVGLDVAHAHLHLMPMNASGDADHAKARSAGIEELTKMQELIKQAIIKHI